MAFEKPRNNKPSNVPRLLQDIIDNAEAVFRYTEGMDLTAFKQDVTTSDAVERCLGRIGEAVARLGHMTPHVMPEQQPLPPWEEFINMGDVLQHHYETVEASWVFDIVRNDLPGFHAGAQYGLRRWENYKLP